MYLTADEDKGGPCVCTSLLMRIKVGRVCMYLIADEDKGGPCVYIPHC